MVDNDMAQKKIRFTRVPDTMMQWKRRGLGGELAEQSGLVEGLQTNAGATGEPAEYHGNAADESGRAPLQSQRRRTCRPKRHIG
jgi:hypothetical protein